MLVASAAGRQEQNKILFESRRKTCDKAALNAAVNVIAAVEGSLKFKAVSSLLLSLEWFSIGIIAV